MYTQDDTAEAPSGHLRIVGTPAEIVAYPINETDLCVLVNVNGVCAYRATLRNALTNITPHTEPNPLIDDTFVIRDLAQVRSFVAEMTNEQIEDQLRKRLT